jgi:hypothetical protein
MFVFIVGIAIVSAATAGGATAGAAAITSSRLPGQPSTAQRLPLASQQAGW